MISWVVRFLQYKHSVEKLELLSLCGFSPVGSVILRLNMIICVVFALIFTLDHVYLPDHCHLCVFCPKMWLARSYFIPHFPNTAFSQYCKSLSCAVLAPSPSIYCGRDIAETQFRYSNTVDGHIDEYFALCKRLIWVIHLWCPHRGREGVQSTLDACV
jgi:hypothetical protein